MSGQMIDLPKDHMGDFLSVAESGYVPGSLWIYVNHSDLEVGGFGAVVHPTALLQALHDLGVDVVGFQPYQSLGDKILKYLGLATSDEIAGEIMDIINNHKEDNK